MQKFGYNLELRLVKRLCEIRCAEKARSVYFFAHRLRRVPKIRPSLRTAHCIVSSNCSDFQATLPMDQLGERMRYGPYCFAIPRVMNKGICGHR